MTAIDWAKWGRAQLRELHDAAKAADDRESSYLPVACPACDRGRLLPYDAHTRDDDLENPALAAALGMPADRAPEAIDEPVCEKCGWRPSREIAGYSTAPISVRVREPHEDEWVDVRPIALSNGSAPEVSFTVEELEQVAHDLLEVARRAAVDVARRDALREGRRAGFEGARATEAARAPFAPNAALERALREHAERAAPLVFERLYLGKIPGHPGGLGLIRTTDGPGPSDVPALIADAMATEGQSINEALAKLVENPRISRDRVEWRELQHRPDRLAPRSPLDGRMLEIAVDGVAVWQGTWEPDGPMRSRWETRWLVDPEHIAER